MEEWWRLNQGYVVVAAFFALLALRVAARRWARRHVARAAQRAADGVTWDTLGNPVVDRLLASIATEVHLDTDLAGADRVLAATRFPRWWQPGGEREWVIAEGGLRTVATLVPAEGGTRLVLREAIHRSGLPTSERDWRTLRRAVRSAAASAGVPAREEPGAPLQREPDRWVRGRL